MRDAERQAAVAGASAARPARAPRSSGASREIQPPGQIGRREGDIERFHSRGGTGDEHDIARRQIQGSRKQLRDSCVCGSLGRRGCNPHAQDAFRIESLDRVTSGAGAHTDNEAHLRSISEGGGTASVGSAEPTAGSRSTRRREMKDERGRGSPHPRRGKSGKRQARAPGGGDRCWRRENVQAGTW